MAQSKIRNPQTRGLKVLLVKPSLDDVHLIEEMLPWTTDTQFELKSVSNLSTGIECLARGGVDIVLLDISLSDVQGLADLVRLHARVPEVPIVLLDSLENEALAVKAIQQGAQDYLVKGQVDNNLLISSIHYAIERQQIWAGLEQHTKRLQDLLYSLDNIVQKSPDGIVIVDRMGVVRFVNPAAEVLLGRNLQELSGKMFGYPIVKGEKTEIQVIRKNDDMATVDIYVVEMEWKGERVYLASLRDVTDYKQKEKQLKHLFINLAETISRAIGSRDPYTLEHQQRVAALVRLVGEKMGLDEDRLQGIYIGSLLHDIGTLSTPESILAKSDGLSEEEWSIIHAHSQRGYDILKDTMLPWPVADMALHHHERLDGSGYPDAIRGDQLSMEVRILAVCDVVEAMSSPRHHRQAKNKEEILEEIKGDKRTKYDAAVVDVMEQILENGEFEL